MNVPIRSLILKRQHEWKTAFNKLKNISTLEMTLSPWTSVVSIKLFQKETTLRLKTKSVDFCHSQKDDHVRSF